MKNRIGVLDVDDGTLRKNPLHAGIENLPLIGAVEVVTHKESAAQKVLAHFGGLLVGQGPVADFDAIEERISEDFIAIVEIDGLLNGAHVNSSEPAQGFREVAIRARIVHGPV